MNETGETGEPKAKVLLAEDDRMTRLIASSSLVKHGYQVVEVDNGGAAYDKAISEQPDIILLDVQMPVMDGFEVLKKLRADPSTVATPVILLTGMPADQGEIAAWEMGACHYITKPWEPGVVEATIRVALQEAGVSVPSEIDEEPEEPEQPEQPDGLGGLEQPGEPGQSSDVVHLKADKVNQIAMQAKLARLKSGRKNDDSANSQGEAVPLIQTGEKLIALEQKMGGGLPLGTVTLAAGAASSGKSTLCQHLLYGALVLQRRVVW